MSSQPRRCPINTHPNPPPMASETALQQFPTMSSFRRPVQKDSTRSTKKSTAGLPEFDMFPPLGKTNGFVIQITETTPPPPGNPSVVSESLYRAGHSPRQKPQPPPLAIPPKAYISDDQRPATTPSPPASLPTGNQAKSPTEVPLPRSSTKSPKSPISRSNSGATPIMRSMFPRYDPNKPFTQQQYRPDIDRVPGLARAMAVAGTSSYRPPSYSHEADNRPSSAYLQLEREKMRAGDTKDSPFRSAESVEPKAMLSTPEQLLDLWDVANGQTSPEEVIDTYTLELSW